MTHLVLGVAVVLLTAIPAFGQVLSLTSGVAILTPNLASASAVGPGVSVQVSGDPIATSVYPECAGCPGGTRVNLSAIWLDSVDVFAVFTLRNSTFPGFDPAPTLAIVAGSVVLPSPTRSTFSASVPFMTVVIEDAARLPTPMPSIAYAGGGVATASFTEKSGLWHLDQVIYTFDEPATPPRIKRKPRQ